MKLVKHVKAYIDKAIVEEQAEDRSTNSCLL